jgi:DNA-binding NarL/FixJ family response regulator
VPDGVVSLLTKEEQLAARLVDVLLGANISVLKLAMVETEPEMSQRLTAFLADFPFLHEIFDVGVEAVLVAAELTPRQREAYYMHLQGATDNDIALFMGLHPSTVRVYVSDGHLKLRELPGEIGV